MLDNQEKEINKGQKFCTGRIVIIAGMLLPALNRARQTAQKVNCQSNVKQWGVYYLQYVTDAEDRILPYYIPGNGTPWRGYTRTDGVADIWVRLLLPYMGFKDGEVGPDPNTNQTNYYEIKNTAKRGGIFVCPAQKMTKPNRYIGAVHYGMPSGMYGRETSEYNLPVRLSGVRSISSRALIFDTYNSAGYESEHWPEPALDFTNNVFGCGSYTFQSYGSGLARRRHQNSSNGVFLDGHVENVKNTELYKHTMGRKTVTEPNMFWYAN